MTHRTRLSSTVSGLLAAAGLVAAAQGSISIGPADVITWGGLNAGRSAPGTSLWQSATASGTSTLAWNATVPNDPVIDSSGRVYFRSEVAATPQIGTLNTPRGVFTATNNTDIAVWQNLIDGNLTPTGGYRLGTRTLATTGNGIGFSGTLRVSGTQVGLGVRIGDPSNTTGTAGGGTLGLNETTSNSPALNINNSIWFGGTYGTIGQVMKRNDPVALPASEYNVVAATGIARTSVDLSAITPANIDMNASGVTVINGSLYTGTTSTIQDPIISNIANGAGATPGAGDKIIATKSGAGAYSVVIHDGSKPGYTHPYSPGSLTGESIKDSGTAGGATFVKINRNGQVAHDAGFTVNAATGVTAANDSALWIHSGATGNVMVYREGETFNSPAGSLYTGGAILGPRSFSNAGVLYTAALANPTTPGTPGGVLGDGQPGDGDVSTVAGSANNAALLLSTSTATTVVARQNDTAPGTLAADNIRLGAITQNSLSISNGGMLGFSSALQGSVTAPVAGSNIGNNAALFGGPSNALQMIARRGGAAPGFDGGVYNLALSSSATNNIVMNDNGVVLFSSPVVTGVAADGSYTSLTTMTSSALFGWMPGGTAFPILYNGQSVEVDSDIFKTISAFSISSVDNGDGGAMGLDNNNNFTARLTFSDGTWSVIKLQIPAPGTGGLALLGLGALARRRRY